MSDVGLNSNIYMVSNKYLNYFNKFLVEVNYDKLKVSDKSVNDVKDTLKKLANPEDFQIQMIFNIIENYLREKDKDLNLSEIILELVKDFDSNNYLNEKSISKIELFSAALDKECDYAFSRILKR